MVVFNGCSATLVKIGWLPTNHCTWIHWQPTSTIICNLSMSLRTCRPSYVWLLEDWEGKFACFSTNLTLFTLYLFCTVIFTTLSYFPHLYMHLDEIHHHGSESEMRLKKMLRKRKAALNMHHNPRCSIFDDASLWQFESCISLLLWMKCRLCLPL